VIYEGSSLLRYRTPFGAWPLLPSTCGPQHCGGGGGGAVPSLPLAKIVLLLMPLLRRAHRTVRIADHALQDGRLYLLCLCRSVPLLIDQPASNRVRFVRWSCCTEILFSNRLRTAHQFQVALLVLETMKITSPHCLYPQSEHHATEEHFHQ
jgi:hypothetical protein